MDCPTDMGAKQRQDQGKGRQRNESGEKNIWMDRASVHGMRMEGEPR